MDNTPMDGNHYIIHTAQYESVMLMTEMFDRGQVVLPKRVRDMLKLKKGVKFSVSVEGQKIVLQPQSSWVAEFDALCAGAGLTDKETDALIAKGEKKRLKEMMQNVPGL